MCSRRNATQRNLELGDGKEDGDNGCQSGYWVSEAEEAVRGERWWSTEHGKSAGSPKPIEFRAQVSCCELTGKRKKADSP